jgi:hypothetical protein
VNQIENVVRRLDRLSVDREQHVAALDARESSCARRRDLGSNDSLGASDPEHAIFHFVPARSKRNVGCRECEETGDDRQREAVPPPTAGALLLTDSRVDPH